MNYFFHNSIKNYTIALLDLFNDIHIPRLDSDGNRIEDIVVPIKFGSRDKAYSISDIDIENLYSRNVNVFPRMVLSFNGLNKAPIRDTNSLHKINKRGTTTSRDLMREYQYNAVAYDFEFTIYIATRTFTDATIIIEQIAPMFRPAYNLKIQELDIQDSPTSIPVDLGEFSITLPEEIAEDEIRIIEVEFPLTLQGNLYLPIKESSTIKEMEVSISNIESIRDSKGILYEIEEKDAIISLNGNDLDPDTKDEAEFKITNVLDD